MRCPLKNTSPDVGVRKPPIIRNVVVFPHPLGPSNVRNSLLLMYRLIPSRTVTPSSNVMERFDKRMSFSDIYHPPFHFNISAELPDFSARPACIFPTIRQKNPRESDRIPCGFSLSREKAAARSAHCSLSDLPFWIFVVFCVIVRHDPAKDPAKAEGAFAKRCPSKYRRTVHPALRMYCVESYM